MIKSLNQLQQKQLGFFKALELTNASIKTGLIKVSPKFNQTITQLVRTLIANKTVIIGNETFDISDSLVTEIITEGLQMFQEWKSGLSNGQSMQALSEHICKELRPWVFDGLICLKLNLPEYSEEFVEKINSQFLEV